jgi:hypothetical protein
MVSEVMIMGLLTTPLKFAAVVAAPTVTSYLLDHYILGGKGLGAEMISHAVTAGSLYLAASKVFADKGLEGILKKLGTGGAKLGGVYMCTYDLTSGTGDIPGKIAYLWNGLSVGVSKVGWLVDLVAKSNYEHMIYNGMSLNGLSGHLRPEHVSTFAAGYFTGKDILGWIKSKLPHGK